MMVDLEEQIGFEYLVAMHLNDSKGTYVRKYIRKSFATEQEKRI